MLHPTVASSSTNKLPVSMNVRSRNERIVGISKRTIFPGGSLHKNIKRRQAAALGAGGQPDSQSTPPTMKDPAKKVKDEDINAPPESSSDEEEDPISKQDHDSDEEYEHSQKNLRMRSTRFGDRQQSGAKAQQRRSEENTNTMPSQTSLEVLLPPGGARKKNKRQAKFQVYGGMVPSKRSREKRKTPALVKTTVSGDPISPKKEFKPPSSPSPESNSPPKRLRSYSGIESDPDSQPPPDFKPPTEWDSSSDSRKPGKKGLKRKHPPGKSDALPIDSNAQLSQMPAFRMPLDDGLSFSFNDNALNDSEALREIKNEEEYRLKVERDESPSTPRCPMCNEEVDRELLEKHLKGGRMNIKKQTAFCRLHKRRTASVEKGYPKVNWETLEDRCLSHEKHLSDILNGHRPSHYRDMFTEKVNSGKNRTLLTTQDNMTPGYYGPRGLRVMTEFIMRVLSSTIRTRAIEDRLISARSSATYVQAVLVPELAVRLIMEDMAVGEDKAGQIMQESVEIGELLYDEVGDVVRNEEEMKED